MRTPTKGQPPERLTRDDVLDNITLYWLTNTGVSSARSYWDNKPPYFGRKNFSIPAAVTVPRRDLPALPALGEVRLLEPLLLPRRR